MEKTIKRFFNPVSLALGIIVLIGFFIRVAGLWDNVVVGYDQARDAQRIYEMITDRNMKLVGPETDIPGVFNGPLLYYFLAPIYFISQFDLNFAGLAFVIINLSGILLMYGLAVILTKNKRVGLLAGFLWSISVAQANFARYISNASPMSITTLVFFLGLALWIFRKKQLGFVISLIGLALAVHLNFYLIYLIIFYPLIYFTYQPKLRAKNFLLGSLVFLVIISPFLIAEILWKFQMTKTMLSYFTHHGNTTIVLDRISDYLQKIASLNYYSFFSFNFLLALVFGIFFVVVANNCLPKPHRNFIILWLASTFPLFAFHSGVHTVEVINSSIYGAFTLVVAIGLVHFYEKKHYRLFALGVLILIVSSNLKFMIANQMVFDNLFESEYPVHYRDYKKLIDYTYQEAKGEEFSICALTVPLFINTKWSFLYLSYGQQKYGYLPYWTGQKQYFNRSYLPDANKITKLRFLIIEPPIGMPKFAAGATLYLENQVSNLITERRFGELRVQKRYYQENLHSSQKQISPKGVDALTIKQAISSDPRYSCFVINE
jgi:hypothetical protein